MSAYLIITGSGLLFTKGHILIPIVGWLRQRSDDELDLLLRLGAKAFIGTGLAMLALWAWRRRARTPAS